MKYKIVNITGKRQITIPQELIKALDFNNQAECVMQKDAITIRHIRENTGSNFSEQIIFDLIAQGFLGQQLLAKFNERSKKIVPAMDKLIDEADSIAKGEKDGATMSDIFGVEDE
jgi:bifunctional DNA-binding transcriptional regulator/antitoxin component of YhaV-PrlF toxin-antitoxin module